jgi:hypothetical protein
MKNIRKNIDALFDIATIAVLVFTVLMVVPDGFMKFLLIVAGCGAMFNNCKYLFNLNKKKRK